MKRFTPVYIPVGVPTFHLESARDLFERSIKLLQGADPAFIVPDDMLLSVDSMTEYISDLEPDLIVFQDLTFANAAYISEVISRFDCPVLLWTLREPVIDGTRLRLNSLTGAYSAANAMRLHGRTDYGYVFGSPEEESVISRIEAFVKAAKGNVRTQAGHCRRTSAGIRFRPRTRRRDERSFRCRSSIGLRPCDDRARKVVQR